MSRRRRLMAGTLAVSLAALLALVLSPKPALYAGVTFSTAVTDRNGRLMRLTLADDDRYRLRHNLGEIAGTAVDATLLYEDRHFRSHPGVNPAALLRAAWSTYISRDRVMGASTITMQLARLRFSLDTRSVGGKLKQITRALQLERHYSKDDILEAYLNLAPYGGNIEGIGTAAQIYFGKPATELTLTEALALAVIPQNPAARDPSTARGALNMSEARGRLLSAWAESHEVGADTYAQFALPLAVRSTRELPFRAPQFSQQLASTAAGHGTLVTSIDLDKQTLLERHVERYAEARQSQGIRNASAMLVDTRTMQVLASVGSADFFDDALQGQVDGTTARRSPGSTLKPFVYGLAMDRGIVHPGSLLKDAPTRFAAYTPENFDRGFMGPIKARDALMYSRNVPAIQLLSKVGHDSFHAFLSQAGVSGLQSADFYGLAAVLGGNELSMRELVAMYAMLANEGTLKPLVTVLDGATAAKGKRLLSREASFLTLDMLRQTPRPDRLSAVNAADTPAIAWKTGTSYAFRDAWTVGVFGPYVLAVWIGNFDGSGNPAFVGRSAAAPLFFNIADSLLQGRPGEKPAASPPPGLNVRKVDVCADTGDLPGRHCPRTEESWFIPGVSPIRVSNVHRAIRIDSTSGLRACSFDPGTTHEKVYAFWPSDILALYRKAGVSIVSPPAWSPECSIEVQSTAGLAPSITSPSSQLIYHTRMGQTGDDGIALLATTDSDVRKLFWFVNDRLVAEVERDEAFVWKPSAGEYRVLAVDDLGRSDARRLLVAVSR
ncbi:MAG: penicillin-binding protein 1C [Pseudomonadota bacterium]